ncbi:MAG: RluA family pseudouridine synthase [Polyangia bacterium]
MIDFTVEDHEVGQRIDQVVARRISVSVNEVRRLLDAGKIRVHPTLGALKKSTLLQRGTHVQVLASPQQEGARVVAETYVPVPETGPLEVLHRDEAIIVVNKPFGMATHPLKAGELGTVANRLAALYPECAAASADPRDGGFVHRLDRQTSGVLVAARTAAAYTALRESFSKREVDKLYWALVHGRLPGERTIDAPLVTRAGLAKIDHEDPKALEATTHVRVLVSSARYTLVEATTSTGRMHQIRAHLAYIGYPLVYDGRYGAPDEDRDDAQLHARSLSLPHPIDGQMAGYTAPLPSLRHDLFEALLGDKVPTTW